MSSNSADEGRLNSVLGPRLAHCADPHDVPELEDLNLDDAKKAAVGWQKQRTASDWNEMAWMGPGDRWVREVHSLFGMGGELILVCAEAEIEKVLHLRALEKPSGDANVAWRMRSIRFFAEGQMNYLTVFGHLVTNIAVRTLRLSERWTGEAEVAIGLETAQFAPNAESKQAWLSFNKPTVGAIRALAEQFGSDYVGLPDSLADLMGKPAWVRLFQLRGGQYHRNRGESPGVAAPSRSAALPWDILMSGGSVGFPRPTNDRAEDAQTFNDLVTTSRAALDAVAPWMKEFHQAWHSAYRAAADERPIAELNTPP